MRFTETRIRDLWLVEPERIEDSRGSFARTYCIREFTNLGLPHRFVQHSISLSHLKHTLRGLHFQKPPHQEVKLVSCVRGAIWDVAVDLRPESPSYLSWASTVLSQENGAQFLIPKGFAHGFQSLCNDAAVSYMISEPHAAGSASGLRYDDPEIGIIWPAAPAKISDRDLAWTQLPARRSAGVVV